MGSPAGNFEGLEQGMKATRGETGGDDGMEMVTTILQ